MMQSLSGHATATLLTRDANLRSSVAGMMPPAPITNASAMSVSIESEASVTHTNGLRKPMRRAVGMNDNGDSASDVEIDFDSLYLAMTSGKNRWDATARMVEWLAKHCPGANVRCGLGGKRLSRFFDARLGWLGAESNLQRELTAQWKQLVAVTAESQFTETQITLQLRRTGQGKTAVLCFSGECVTAALFDTLKKHERVMGSILWGQPVIAFPAWSLTSGRSRVSIMIAGLLLLLLFLFPVSYRAACTVRVEPVGARAVSAPFEATLESVLVDPGDEVHQGQPLVQLDGRPLRLEQQSIDAEIQQATKQQDVAIAAGRIAESQQAQLKCQQLQRQSELLQRRLSQLTVTSPIDGVIVVGDLRRSIGATLEIGQVMFEVASLESVILEIEIPEREIGLVSDDSAVQVRVDAARVGTVAAALRQIYPSAQLRDDQSVFIAPIEVDNQDRHYRPGMRGKATVYGPIRPWAWSHLRSVFEQATWLLGF